MSKSKCYIALLRGINVSGHKKILMKDLAVLFEGCGFTDVKTYIQSGNVVFYSTKSKNLDKKIHNKIKEQYGWEVPIMILTPDQIKHILKQCPWDEQQQPKSYYCLMQKVPEPHNLEKLMQYSFKGEEFVVANGCVYLNYSVGAGDAKISTNFLESKLKVSCTSRNHRTMAKLLAIASEN